MRVEDRATRARRHEGLDGLRGLAILGVLIFHVWIVRAQWGWWWRHTVEHGAHGVGLFFAVSALTLALSWQARQAVDQQPRWAFWMRRWWRIGPLYYLMLAVYWGFGVGNPQAAPTDHVFTWSNLLAHLTFAFDWIPAAQNSWIGVEWSIGVEVAFYLAFPWVMAWLAPRTSRPTQVGMLVAAGALGLGWPWLLDRLHGGPWPSWAEGYPTWTLFAQLPAFAAGLWVWRSRPPQPRWQWAAVLGVVALWAAVSLRRWPLSTTATVWSLPIGALTWAVWHDLPLLGWVARSPILRYIGLRSYSWYLTHWILLLRVVLVWPPAASAGWSGFAWRLFAALVVTAAAGELGYQLVEKPGQQVGRYLLRRWGWGPAAQAPPARRTAQG